MIPGDERVARRRPEALPDPVDHPEAHHLPRRARHRDQRPHQHRRGVADQDERRAPAGPVGQPAAHHLEHRGGQVRRAVEQPEQRGAAAERAGDEGREERVDHLAREIVEQRDERQSLDRRRDPAHVGRGCQVAVMRGTASPEGSMVCYARMAADPVRFSRIQPLVDAHPRPGSDHRRHPPGADPRRVRGASSRASGLTRVRPRFYLSTEWGVPFETVADRHPVLPRPSGPHGAPRRAGGARRGLRPGRHPPLPAARDGARRQLRLPALRRGGMGQAVRLDHPALRRGVPAGAVQPALRAAPAGLVRPEAPGRGLVGDLRGVDDAGTRLAEGVRRLAGGRGQAGVLRAAPWPRSGTAIRS